jgi:ADP-ribose pyrophosphatase YjhB (NUDIX family)
MEPNWLKWAKQLAALAQNGLTYSDSAYEIERYEQIRHIAAEMMATGFQLETKTVLELFPREKGYETPKVDVRGAAFRDGKILLVREKLDGDRWTLPGGWADPCQTPSEAVVREIWEESGFEARVLKLAAVWDRSKHPHRPLMPFHIYKLFFCEITGGTATESHETTGVGFFAEDEIPPELSISRTLPFQLARMFEHYRNPALPTDFD